MVQFRVRTQTGSYEVAVGRAAWRRIGAFCRRAGYSSVFIVTEPGIWKHWGKHFLGETGFRSKSILLIPSGERSKSLRQVRVLAEELIERGADRESALVALGGGMVGDVAGFVGSIYMRGIDTLQAPTTMVGQVDSAIGGKNGVNLPGAKNILGSLAPPRLVAANPEVLRSLSPRAYRSGLFEVIKHGIIRDPALFRFLEQNREAILSQSPRVMERLVAWGAKIKVQVVVQDEKESGLRRILNFGHTLGHALEAATGYRRLLHGEAVGWGMLMATRIAAGKKMLARREEEKIRALIGSYGPLPSLQGINSKQLIPFLARDKKTVRGVVHWILPVRVGAVRVTSRVSTREIQKAILAVQSLSLGGAE